MTAKNNVVKVNHAEIFSELKKRYTYKKSFLGILSKESKIRENIKEYKEEIQKDFEKK